MTRSTFLGGGEMFIVRECQYVCGGRKGRGFFFPPKKYEMRLVVHCGGVFWIFDKAHRTSIGMFCTIPP